VEGKKSKLCKYLFVPIRNCAPQHCRKSFHQTSSQEKSKDLRCSEEDIVTIILYLTIQQSTTLCRAEFITFVVTYMRENMSKLNLSTDYTDISEINSNNQQENISARK
jgi:hypothetical protein